MQKPDRSEVLKELEGLTPDEARRAVGPFGYTLRVVKADGKGRFITDDYVRHRINVETVDNVITCVNDLG